MDLKSLAKATSKVLISYLTYQAMRTVVEQLQQTNPPLAHWLSGFSSAGKLQDGDLYIEELLKANQELAFRLMTVREHLAEEVVEFLPEMTLTGVKESNLRLRCQHLEKIVNYEPSADLPALELEFLDASDRSPPDLNPEISEISEMIEMSKNSDHSDRQDLEHNDLDLMAEKQDQDTESGNNAE
jgi:hypothetical protein